MVNNFLKVYVFVCLFVSLSLAGRIARIIYIIIYVSYFFDLICLLFKRILGQGRAEKLLIGWYFYDKRDRKMGYIYNS